MKKNNHKSSAVLAIISIIIASFMVFSFGCAKKEEKEIKIGAILPLTGTSAQLGETARNGLVLAEQNINAKGGIKGKKLRIIFEDGMADPNLSLSAFKKLAIVDKVKIILTTHSSVGLALAPLADQQKVILFVHASHPRITGKSAFVFRHSNIAEQESSIIADFLDKQSTKKCALAIMDDDYGLIFREKLNQAFSEYRISNVSDVLYDKSETDFKTVAQKLLADRKPDTIIIAGLGNGVGILMRRLKEFGYKGDILL